CPVNRFSLEVVTERKIPQHFKERVVIRSHPDVPNVACTNTLLASRRLSKFERPNPQKLIFELIHPRRCEEDRFVPVRYQHITWPADTSLGFKKFEIFFAKFVGFHRSISVANRKDASRLGPLNAASYQPPANERIEKESLN